MKNKYFSILVVAIVATVASFNIYSSQKETPMSDLALANVEALALDWDHEFGTLYTRHSAPCPVPVEYKNQYLVKVEVLKSALLVIVN